MKRSQIHPKVTAVGVAGASCTALVWTLRQFHVDMPVEVAAAFVTIAAFAAGYLKAS